MDILIQIVVGMMKTFIIVWMTTLKEGLSKDMPPSSVPARCIQVIREALKKKQAERLKSRERRAKVDRLNG